MYPIILIPNMAKVFSGKTFVVRVKNGTLFTGNFHGSVLVSCTTIQQGHRMALLGSWENICG